MLPVQVKVLDHRLLGLQQLPSYATSSSAGLDLRAMSEEDFVLKPNEVKLVPTGLSVYLEDPNYVGLLFPRSGTGHKKGLVLGNLTGVIDADYQGPLMLSLWNRSQEDVLVSVGERVAQYVVVPCMQIDIEYVEIFRDQTDRAEGGFGSTGSS